MIDEPAALRVRPEQPPEEPAVRAVVAAAFGREDVAALLDGLRQSVAWLGLSLVADDRGEVVGLGFAAPSVRIPPAAFQVFVLPSYHSSVSGALVYPDVFWRHDAVGLRS